jgi:hypothetical protein
MLRGILKHNGDDEPENAVVNILVSGTVPELKINTV